MQSRRHTKGILVAKPYEGRNTALTDSVTELINDFVLRIYLPPTEMTLSAMVNCFDNAISQTGHTSTCLESI